MTKAQFNTLRVMLGVLLIALSPGHLTTLKVGIVSLFWAVSWEVVYWLYKRVEDDR